jgi:hypothetical protein
VCCAMIKVCAEPWIYVCLAILKMYAVPRQNVYQAAKTWGLRLTNGYPAMRKCVPYHDKMCDVPRQNVYHAKIKCVPCHDKMCDVPWQNVYHAKIKYVPCHDKMCDVPWQNVYHAMIKFSNDIFVVITMSFSHDIPLIV